MGEPPKQRWEAEKGLGIGRSEHVLLSMLLAYFSELLPFHQSRKREAITKAAPKSQAT